MPEIRLVLDEVILSKRAACVIKEKNKPLHNMVKNAESLFDLFITILGKALQFRP